MSFEHPVKKRVVLVEDDLETIKYISELLSNSTSLELFSVSTSIEEFYQKGLKQNFEIMLLDLNLPGISGIAALPDLVKKYPDIDIVILTVIESSEKIFQALRFGATGYLLKSDSIQILDNELRVLALGGAPISYSIARKVIDYFKPKNNLKSLSVRDQAMLKLLAEGNSYDEVAKEMNVSINVVRYYIKKIYSTLHVDNKVDAVRKYYSLIK